MSFKYAQLETQTIQIYWYIICYLSSLDICNIKKKHLTFEADPLVYNTIVWAFFDATNITYIEKNKDCILIFKHRVSQ